MILALVSRFCFYLRSVSFFVHILLFSLLVTEDSSADVMPALGIDS